MRGLCLRKYTRGLYAQKAVAAPRAIAGIYLAICTYILRCIHSLLHALPNTFAVCLGRRSARQAASDPSGTSAGSGVQQRRWRP